MNPESKTVDVIVIVNVIVDVIIFSDRNSLVTLHR